MRLEPGADVECRRPDLAVPPEEQGHEQAPHASVAVQEGVQGLEFGVQDGELDQPVGRVRMDISLPCAHGVGEALRIDGHEFGFVDGAAGRPDPDGRAPVLAGGLVLTPDMREQHPVRLADDPLAKRQVPHHILGPPHGGAVVEDLMDVLATRRRSRLPPRLELQDLDPQPLARLRYATREPLRGWSAAPAARAGSGSPRASRRNAPATPRPAR